MQSPIIVQTTGLLVLSNVFMTIAWYGHLKHMSSKGWWYAALAYPACGGLPAIREL